jgi:hypothetical protein
MKRFSKKWIAVAGVVVVALAVLVLVLLPEREPVPHFRFLGNHVPVIRETFDKNSATRWTTYKYEFKGEFDSIANEAAQDLMEKGFVRRAARDAPPGTAKRIQYQNDNQEVSLDGNAPPAPTGLRWIEVDVTLRHDPPLFWQRLRFKIRRALGL